jgi:hypothetical protein
VLSGEPVATEDGILVLGAPDPRSSGLGNWRVETGTTMAEQEELLAEAACDSRDDGERIATMIVHDSSLGEEALERPGRCGRLQLHRRHHRWRRLRRCARQQAAPGRPGLPHHLPGGPPRRDPGRGHLHLRPLPGAAVRRVEPFRGNFGVPGAGASPRGPQLARVRARRGRTLTDVERHGPGVIRRRLAAARRGGRGPRG